MHPVVIELRSLRGRQPHDPGMGIRLAPFNSFVTTLRLAQTSAWFKWRTRARALQSAPQPCLKTLWEMHAVRVANPT